MGMKISMSIDINVNKFIMTNVFEPTDIAGALLWLDAADSATISAAGSEVSSWTDKVAGKVFSNPTSANRPSLNNTFFAKNSIDFGENGVQWLQTSTPVSIGAANTIFFVTRWGESAGGYAALALQRNSNYNSIVADDRLNLMVYAVGASDGYIQLSDAGNYNYTPSATLTRGANSLVTSTIDGAMSTGVFRLNGTEVSDDVAGTFTGGDFDTVGSSDTLYKTNGAFAEVIVYNRVLTNEEILQVEGYLKDKWGTP